MLSVRAVDSWSVTSAGSSLAASPSQPKMKVVFALVGRVFICMVGRRLGWVEVAVRGIVVPSSTKHVKMLMIPFFIIFCVPPVD